MSRRTPTTQRDWERYADELLRMLDGQRPVYDAAMAVHADFVKCERPGQMDWTLFDKLMAACRRAKEGHG